jgi:hypothetical protein
MHTGYYSEKSGVINDKKVTNSVTRKMTQKRTSSPNKDKIKNIK